MNRGLCGVGNGVFDEDFDHCFGCGWCVGIVFVFYGSVDRQVV